MQQLASSQIVFSRGVPVAQEKPGHRFPMLYTVSYNVFCICKHHSRVARISGTPFVEELRFWGSIAGRNAGRCVVSASESKGPSSRNS